MCKQITFLLTILLSFFSSNASSSKHDSLYNVFNDASLILETRMEALIKFNYNNNIGPDSMLIYNQKGIDLAKKRKNMLYQLVFTNLNAESYTYQFNNYKKAEELFNECLIFSNKLNNLKYKVKAFKGLADLSMYQNKMVVAKGFYNKSISRSH